MGRGLLQPTHLVFVLLIVLIIFGPGKLPDLGRSLGKGIREFKRSLTDTQDAIMGSDDARQNLPPRQTDSSAPQSQSSPPAGEPKRLSQ